LNEKDSFSDEPLDVEIPLNGNDTFEIPMAYASYASRAKGESINLEYVERLSHFRRGSINLTASAKSRREAGKVINFYETAYLFSCEARDGENYLFTLYIDRDIENDRSLYSYYIQYGDGLFNKKGGAASARAGKNVIVQQSKRRVAEPAGANA